MKKQLYFVGAIAAIAFGAASSAANAATITYTQDQSTVPADFITAPTTSTGNFTLSTSGSNTYQSSPFPNQTSPYSCLSCGGPAQVAGSATYDLAAGSTGFSIFWGSPDSYNSVTFMDGSTALQTVTGADLLPPPGSGHNLVSFNFNGDTVTSVVLSDTGVQAFEYSDVTATPLPAALPLFMGGLGLIGLVSRRRKRQIAAA